VNETGEILAAKGRVDQNSLPLLKAKMKSKRKKGSQRDFSKHTPDITLFHADRDVSHLQVLCLKVRAAFLLLVFVNGSSVKVLKESCC
jgi:hypothetical protein